MKCIILKLIKKLGLINKIEGDFNFLVKIKNTSITKRSVIGMAMMILYLKTHKQIGR